MPVRTLNAGPNRKYFNADRGVTYYNFTSDQFTGFHAIVIPGTLRDSMYILDGLLEHQTRLQPGEVMADTAGVSEVVFGLFWLLGYQFSPRMADIGKAKFWRLDPTADYGVSARARANTKLMTRNWDDLLRVAGSLHQGTVSASELMRSSSGANGLPRWHGPLRRWDAFPNLYMLLHMDDEQYRRRMLTQLNRGESRHSVARAVRFVGNVANSATVSRRPGRPTRSIGPRRQRDCPVAYPVYGSCPEAVVRRPPRPSRRGGTALAPAPPAYQLSGATRLC